jgi:hypothetical protein
MLSLSWVAWLSVILIQAIAHFGFLGRKGPRTSSSSSSSSSNDGHESKQVSATGCPESVSLSTENVAQDVSEPPDKIANDPVDSGDSASSKILAEKSSTKSVSRQNLNGSHSLDADTIKQESCDTIKNFEERRRISSYGTFDTCDTISSSCQEDCGELTATRSDSRSGPSFSFVSLQGEGHDVYPEDDTIDDECDSIDDEEWRLQLLKDYYYNDDDNGTMGDCHLEGSTGDTLVDPVPGDSIGHRISETRHPTLYATIQASISVQ